MRKFEMNDEELMEFIESKYMRKFMNLGKHSEESEYISLLYRDGIFYFGNYIFDNEDKTAPTGYIKRLKFFESVVSWKPQENLLSIEQKHWFWIMQEYYQICLYFVKSKSNHEQPFFDKINSQKYEEIKKFNFFETSIKQMLDLSIDLHINNYDIDMYRMTCIKGSNLVPIKIKK